MANKAPILVQIRGPERAWSGQMLPGRVDSVKIVFAFDASPCDLPLATTVNLAFAAVGMTSVAQSDARLTRVERCHGDTVECQFELDDPHVLDDVPGAIVDRTEPRHWVRVEARGHEVKVPVRLGDGRRLVGLLRDGSAAGLGLVFPLVSESHLCTERTLHAEVTWPGMGSREWECDVRHRSLVAPAEVRYGLQFRTETHDADPPGPRFERLWNCDACGSKGLLDDSHRYCPVCGAEQHGEPRTPTLADVATCDRHELCGIDVGCGRCGLAQGARATFCGHCGAELPRGEDDEDLPTQQLSKSPGT